MEQPDDRSIEQPERDDQVDHVDHVEQSEDLDVERRPQQVMTFDEWLAELDRVAVSHFGFSGPIVAQTGRDCWRSYYDDGDTPRGAIAEDLSHGADDRATSGLPRRP
jgi:hypothetical protein